MFVASTSSGTFPPSTTDSEGNIHGLHSHPAVTAGKR